MFVKPLTILIFPLIFLNSCSRKVEVREYVEVVQRPQKPSPQMVSPPRDPMRAGPLTVAPVPENLPPDHPTLPQMHPPMSGGTGPNTMAGRESEVPPAPVVTDVRWDLPAGWKEQRGSGMRIAEFYPEPDHPEALITLIPFPASAGSLEANVVRWRGQIGLGAQGTSDIRHVDGQLHFEFLNLVPESKNAKKPQSIIAAIYQQSDRTLFLKFMGPTEIVETHIPGFLELAKSLRQQEGSE